MILKANRLTCILSLLLFVTLNVNMVDAEDFVTDGLVAMYTLNQSDLKGDVVMDVSGNDNHAKLIGSIEFAEGQIDDAMKFVGSANNYVEIPALGGFEFASVECYALEAAFQGIQGIVSTWEWAAGKVHFKFKSNQIQAQKNDGVKLYYSNTVVNTWYHIVYTTDTAANEYKLYIDGEMIGEGTAGATPENMNERRIGSEHDGRWLNGMMDNVRIYDRVLSADEVMQNFEAKIDTFPVEPTDKLSTIWGILKHKRSY